MFSVHKQFTLQRKGCIQIWNGNHLGETCAQLEDLIARELAIARELLAAKKRECALLALKKKRLREGQLEQIDAYLLNVEQASSLSLSHPVVPPCRPDSACCSLCILLQYFCLAKVEGSALWAMPGWGCGLCRYSQTLRQRRDRIGYLML